MIGLTLGACVTPGDLRAVADAIEDVQSGALTSEQGAALIDAKADEIEARTLAAASSIPTDPLELAVWLAALGATGFGAYKGTMKVRDGKRTQRGENV